MRKIWVLHGPNLNLLGVREPHLYGNTTLAELNDKLECLAKSQHFKVECFQSNHEGELLDIVHNSIRCKVDFMVVNPGAFTHSSIALRDALIAVKIPFIEVHVTNLAKREEYRKVSYFSDISIGLIQGLGIIGYELALAAAISHLQEAYVGQIVN